MHDLPRRALIPKVARLSVEGTRESPWTDDPVRFAPFESALAYAWDRPDRRDEVWRRKQSLDDLRVERNRALLWRWVWRLLTLGLWWK